VLPRPPVLLITDRRQARAPLPEVVAAALEGGCRWVSLREKDLPAEAQIALCRELMPLASACGARLMLHGDPRLAAEAGLSSVHLGAEGDVSTAREVLGKRAWISVSTHGVDEIEAASAAGADAVTLSPIFATQSKPGYGPAVGLDALAQATARSTIPIIALGGIENASAGRACFEAGAAAVAVMGVVMRAGDPAAIMAEIIAASPRSSSAGRGRVRSDGR
jgi:thiamine-phosphate pyrophosphorylase